MENSAELKDYIPRATAVWRIDDSSVSGGPVLEKFLVSIARGRIGACMVAALKNFLDWQAASFQLNLLSLDQAGVSG